MTTPFEHPAELDAQQQERARETFRNLLEESEFDYDVMPGGVIKLTFIGNCGVFVIPDFEHGIMSTDVDTGITLTEERADEAWAFASYSCAFHYNYCLLDTAPAGRVVTKPAWNPGERVHFHTSTLIGARDLRELVSLSLDCATEVRRGVQRILDGESVVDVVHAEDDETSDTMIRHLRDFMTHRHHHFDSEDDEPSPINEAASPAELTSRVVDLFPIAPDKAVGTLWVGTRSYPVKVSRNRHRRVWARVQVLKEIEDGERCERVAIEVARKSASNALWRPLSVDPNDGEVAYTATFTCDLTSETLDRLLGAAKEFLERNGAELDALLAQGERDDFLDLGSAEKDEPFDLSFLFGRP